MKLDIGGEETIQATVEQLWSALNDPLVLTRCIAPVCRSLTKTSLKESASTDRKSVV